MSNERDSIHWMVILFINNWKNHVPSSGRTKVFLMSSIICVWLSDVLKFALFFSTPKSAK